MRVLHNSIIFIILIINFNVITSTDNIISSKNGKHLNENTQLVNLTVIKHNNSHNNNSSTVSLNTSGSSAIIMHNGREHIKEDGIHGNNGSNLNDQKTSPIPISPIYEKLDLDIPPQQDGEKPSVPKKGVSFPDVNQTNQERLPTKLNPNGAATVTKTIHLNSNKTTTKNNTAENHKKPLVTESDDDYIDKLSKIVKQEDNETAKINDRLALDQIDPLLLHKKTKSADYIVPIVAVILSVPLVAIAISFIYKRSSDWWEHRNYKRMDFLIEGMYHN